MSRLSIIIATFNSSSDIVRCLGALHEHPPKVEHDIVVVDNASSDGTVDLVQRDFPNVRVLPLARNIGFAAANNIAIATSQGELLLLLNPDTVVPPGTIDRLVAALDRDPGIAACGPRLVDGSGRVELSFGRMMGPFNELRQKVLVAGHASGWPLVAAHVDRITHVEGDHDWVSGACLCVRRSAADAVGGLDERYFLYAEDVDFCAAIRARGGRIRFVPDVHVVHLRGRSRRSAATASETAYRRSQVAFYEKHHPGWVRWLRWYLQARRRLPDNS